MNSAHFPHKADAANATIEFDGKFLVKSTLKEDVELELSDVIEQRNLCTEITNSQPHVVLVFTAPNTSATKETREYASKNPAPGRIAEAIIVRSMAVRLMGNVYVNYHKPTIPTRMFEKEEDARKWLQEMYDKHVHEK